MIEVDRIHVRFGEGPGAFIALNDVSVTINESEFFTLLGPSGCGKTTLLRSIAGFIHPSGGAIRLAGQNILSLPPFKRPVNTVFQNYALFPHMTVAENVGFGLEMLGRPRAEIAATVEEMLALVKMTPMAGRRPSELSGGQQQRVALARALAPKPKVLLLDESLSALDLKLRKEMQIELKRLQSETGITFIFVTHDQEEALTMSDRIAVMSAGTIRQIGTPREIYDHPRERFVADFIGDTNFVQANLSADGTVELPGGARIRAGLQEDAAVAARPVTLVIRPEQTVLEQVPEKAPLSGVLENVVYCGTDTHYHLMLADGARFVVRCQNNPARPVTFEKGQRLGIGFEPQAVQVLEG